MTKNIELLLGELQSEVPTKFHSVANKSALRQELEKFEDLIIMGISTGHTARGFYEKLKDSALIETLSKEFKPLRAEDTFKKHFIRVFHDYRDALAQEGKVEKPRSRSRKPPRPAGKSASEAKPLRTQFTAAPGTPDETREKLGWKKPELPQVPLKTSEIVEVKPVPATETDKPKIIIPKHEGSSFKDL